MKLNVRFIKLLISFIAASILVGCMESKPEYEFAIGTAGETTIREVTNIFNLNQEIAFRITGDKPIGSSTINIIWIKRNEDSEEFLSSYEVKIDPTWKGVFYEVGNPKVEGDYTLRIFNKDDVLLGEGDFSVRSITGNYK